MDKEMADKNEVRIYKSVEEMLEELEKDRCWYKEIHYWVYRLFQSIGMVPSEILWFIQRGRRGYSDRDIWNFQWYLAWIISNGVNQLKEEKNSCPEDLTVEEWDNILGKISTGFKNMIDSEENLDLWDDKKIMVEIEEGKQLLVNHFESLWD